MLTRLRARLADDSGITMVEVMVVIVLMGIVGSVMTTSLVKGMEASASTQSRFDALTDLQESVDRMTRELRAGAPVQVAESNRVAVVVYRNNFTQQVRYTYQYCPSTQRLHVWRQGPLPTPAPPATSAFPTAPAALDCATTTVPRVADAVSSVVFSYRTRLGATMTTPVNPAQVGQIRVRIQRSLPTQPAITVETVVRLRNVR